MIAIKRILFDDIEEKHSGSSRIMSGASNTAGIGEKLYNEHS
jgi:hypothetical protein